MARELHVTRAAERLGVTQQALSSSIRQLESHLGVRLFDRSTRGVELTDAGRELLERAEGIIDLLDETLRDVQRVASTGGAPPSLVHTRPTGVTLLPQLLAGLRAAYPSAALVVRERRADVPGELRAGRGDLGLLTAPGDELEGLVEQPLLDEPLVAVLGARHPLLGRAELGLAEFARVPLLLPVRAWHRGYVAALAEHCRESGFELLGHDEPLLEDDAWMATTFAASGDAAVLPRSWGAHLARWGVAHVRVVGGLTVRTSLLRPQRELGAEAERLARRLVAAAHQLGWTVAAPGAERGATPLPPG